MGVQPFLIASSLIAALAQRLIRTLCDNCKVIHKITDVDLEVMGINRVPAGSKIHYQLHYTTSGKEETDKTRIGFYFHEDRPEKEFVVMGPANFEFEILPGIKDLPVVANEPINRAINLYAMLPHMHYRGKSMDYVAHYPDGTQEILLSVANYNFNWQRFYYLDEPKYLPVGTTLTVNAVFDNSTQNQFNPDPSKTIYFGEQTFDEMMIGYMSFTYEDETGVSSL